MPLTLNDFIKKQLKIDGSEEDEILALLIAGAKEFLTKAGVPAPLSEDEMSSQFKLAVYIHTLLNYQNYESSLNVDALNNSLTTIILQLRG
jgi:uncharacterized phage protein (predicted DNA packaging)